MQQSEWILGAGCGVMAEQAAGGFSPTPTNTQKWLTGTV